MSISVKVESVRLKREEGKQMDLVGEYHLLSDNGTVMAKQSFNGYNDIKITFSRETIDLIRQLESNVEDDVKKTLGINS